MLYYVDFAIRLRISCANTNVSSHYRFKGKFAVFGIGDLSRETGIKIPTIRYYEKIGLIDAPSRSEGNQRRYTDVERDRLSFIKHARELGLPVDSIRALIRLSAHPEQPCADADQIAREHLEEVRLRLERLRRLEQELERISAGCDGNTVENCYVLRAFSDHSLCDDEHG